jgi:hypothetical protein
MPPLDFARPSTSLGATLSLSKGRGTGAGGPQLGKHKAGHALSRAAIGELALIEHHLFAAGGIERGIRQVGRHRIDHVGG